MRLSRTENFNSACIHNGITIIVSLISYQRQKYLDLHVPFHLNPRHQFEHDQIRPFESLLLVLMQPSGNQRINGKRQRRHWQQVSLPSHTTASFHRRYPFEQNNVFRIGSTASGLLEAGRGKKRDGVTSEQPGKRQKTSASRPRNPS